MVNNSKNQVRAVDPGRKDTGPVTYTGNEPTQPHKDNGPRGRGGIMLGEELLQATDTIVNARIQQANLDKTVLCTVLESDWTNVDKGEYYVSEGDAKYVAMGEPDAYRTNDRVWVLIPLGDYNNQKTIISRQVGDVGDSFVYISPLENFVRLTEDLIPNANKGKYGLKTNDTEKYGVQIASIKLNKSGAVDIGGFSAFGISAKFKTDVAALEIMRGNYGLHLVVNSVKEQIIGTENGVQTKEYSPARDDLYLQCTDMWGNPYGYDMFFEQSKMFEINDPGRTKIESIDVYFFQTYADNDTHITNTAEAIQSGKFVDINHLDVVVPEEDNLFIKDVSIYFGHTADNLNTSAYLYSQSSPNFVIKDGNPADVNDKTLVAKFIHRADNGKNYVLNSLGNNSVYRQLLESGSLPGEFTVRWYIYNPLSVENDLRAGSGWEDITYLLDLKRNFMDALTLPEKERLNQEYAQSIQDLIADNMIRYRNSIANAGITDAQKTVLLKQFYEELQAEYNAALEEEKQEKIDNGEEVGEGEYTYNCIQVDGYGSYKAIHKSDDTIFTDTQRTFRLNDANAGYEKFKVAFILFDSGLYGRTAPTEQDLAEANAVVKSTDDTYSPAQKRAAQKVIDDYEIFNKEIRYWSQEVIFQNGDDQTWGSLDALNSLKLEFDDGGYNGNYLIYDTATAGQAKMLNSGDAHVKRTLKGNFKSYITNETDLTRSSVIRWYIPKDTQTNHTMVSEPDWMDTMFSGYKYNASLTSEDKYEQVTLPIRWKSLNGKIATRANNAWKTEPAIGAWSNTDIDTADTWDKYYIFESVIAKDTEDAELKAGHISITYRIKEYWNQHFTDNTIICKIVRDGKLYEKSVNLVFGSHGTNGTEYSLIVGLGDEYELVHVPKNGNIAAHDEFRLVAENVPAWTITHPQSNFIILNAQLYDERNQALPANEVKYKWKLNKFSPNPCPANTGNLAKGDVFSVGNNTNLGESRWRIRISGWPRTIDINDWCGAYLTCTATYNGHDYTQDMVMPIRSKEEYIGCVGATKVTYTYASTAPAVSSKDAYQILIENYSLEKPGYTICEYNSKVGLPAKEKSKWRSDLPYLSNIKSDDTNKANQIATLILPSVYYNDIDYKMAVKMKVSTDEDEPFAWIQPVLVTLDVYTNTFLNQWDGSLQIDNKHNRIATASIFAGEKNADNGFTGVIMGKLQCETPQRNGGAPSYETGYGIYGRHSGHHTFGINTNGTAYLGDSSKAQLLFRVGEDIDSNNGWQSTIQNYGYDNSQKGMRLDFIGTTTRYNKDKAMEAPYIDIINVNDEDGKDDNNATRTKDNTLNRVTISGNQDHLLEVYAHGKQVMHVGNAQYYLQTADYNRSGVNSTGTILNLETGELLSFGQKDNTTDTTSNHALLISNKGVYPEWQVNGHSATNTDPNTSGNQGGWVLYSHGNFGVDTTGKIHAKAGTIGGWNISSTSLYTGTLTMEKTVAPESGDVRLSSSNFARKICNQEGSAWRLTIGPNFGVTSGGKLYATGAEFSGNITGSTIDGNTITGGTISGSSISGGTISGGAISGGTISGSKISGGSVIGSNVHADNLYLNGSRVYYDTTNVVGIIKGIDLSLDGRTLSAKARFTYKTIYGFGMSDSYEHGSTSESPWGSSVTLPSSGGGGGGGDDSGCILKGTPILMADYSYKNIENIKNNDMVLSYNEQTQTYEPAIVSIGATPFPSHYIYDICLENGEILSLTGSHPLLTTEGWKALNIEMAYKEHKVRTQLLHTGDEVLSINNETYRIKQIIAQPYAENYEVYNIVVPKNKTYFANNLIVHNAGNGDKVIH